jgi:hypothetical protein
MNKIIELKQQISHCEFEFHNPRNDGYSVQFYAEELTKLRKQLNEYLLLEASGAYTKGTTINE